MSNRSSPSKRGYDRTWAKLRRMTLASEPLCRMCKAKGKVVSATVVDHIIPLRQAPELRLDPANLQPLCNFCHNSTKRLEENKTRAPTIKVGADGLPTNENHPFYTGKRTVH